MKKRLPLIFLILLILLNFVSIYGINFYEGVFLSCAYNFKNLTGGNMIYGLMLTKDGTEEYLKSVDKDYLERFYSEGGSVEIVYKDDEKYEDMDVNGLFDTSDNTIYIKDKFECRINPVVVHEFAHYIDRCCTLDADDPAFIEIAQEEIYPFSVGEAFSFVKKYELQQYQMTGNFQEYYATAYEYYVWYPLFLKTVAPQTFSYFNSEYGLY